MINTLQGILPVTGLKVYTATQPCIVKGKFTNPSTYNLVLYKYNADSGTDKLPLFALVLNGGDVVDTEDVLLDTGDYLFAKPNITGTTYILEIEST